MTLIAFNEKITQFRIADFTVHYFHPTISLPGFTDRAVFDLSELIASIDWSDDIDAAALQCTIRFNYHEKLKDIVGAGGIFTIFGYAFTPSGTVYDELYRVSVIETNVDTDDSGTATFVAKCFDHMFYTVNNDHTVKYPAGNKASDIIINLCTEFQIPMGTIEDTVTPLGRLIFRNNSLYDMMITALSESRYIDGQRYVLRMERGKLNLRKQTLPTQIFVLAYGENLYKAGLAKSIARLRTRVRLYGQQTSDDLGALVDQSNLDPNYNLQENDVLKLYAEANDSFMQQYYGLLQHIETGVTPESLTDIQGYAEHLLSTLNKVDWTGTLSAPSINTIRWGDAIYVYEPITGMVGQFYVMSSHHTIDEGGARMDLQIHYEARLPEILFEKYEKMSQDEIDELTRIVDENNLAPHNEEYISPLAEPYQIIQEYGANPFTRYNPSAAGHTGIDMARGSGPSAIGTNIRAVQDGTVISAGVDPQQLGGNMVVIDHDDGYRSLYAHMDTIYSKKNSIVKKGGVIGTVGQTGSADPAVNPGGGPHLHFQLIYNGKTINPRAVVPIHK